jgi:hypothetical protein
MSMPNSPWTCSGAGGSQAFQGSRRGCPAGVERYTVRDLDDENNPEDFLGRNAPAKSNAAYACGARPSTA